MRASTLILNRKEYNQEYLDIAFNILLNINPFNLENILKTFKSEDLFVIHELIKTQEDRTEYYDSIFEEIFKEINSIYNNNLLNDIYYKKKIIICYSLFYMIIKSSNMNIFVSFTVDDLKNLKILYQNIINTLFEEFIVIIKYLFINKYINISIKNTVKTVLINTIGKEITDNYIFKKGINTNYTEIKDIINDKNYFDILDKELKEYQTLKSEYLNEFVINDNEEEIDIDILTNNICKKKEIELNYVNNNFLNNIKSELFY